MYNCAFFEICRKFCWWMPAGMRENGLKTTQLPLKFSSIMILLGMLKIIFHFTYGKIRSFKAFCCAMHLNLQWYISMLLDIWLPKIRSTLRIFGFQLLHFWWPSYQECTQFSTSQETGLKRNTKWNEKPENSRYAIIRHD